jgi:hypothetical protein
MATTRCHSRTVAFGHVASESRELSGCPPRAEHSDEQGQRHRKEGEPVADVVEAVLADEEELVQRVCTGGEHEQTPSVDWGEWRSGHSLECLSIRSRVSIV